MEDSASHHKTGSTHPAKQQQLHQQPSSSELLSSAKLMAEAAKATFSHESDKVDKGRVAGAAADLLDAASHYGKMEEKSFGQYIEKAENYLHQYDSSHSTTTTTTSTTTTTGPTTHSPSHPGGESGDHGHSGSGYGDYLKMAEGFLNQSSHSTTTSVTTTHHSASHQGGESGDHGDSGSGNGDYLKMAEGFLKKH